jgi:hypothetical protein
MKDMQLQVEPLIPRSVRPPTNKGVFQHDACPSAGTCSLPNISELCPCSCAPEGRDAPRRRRGGSFAVYRWISRRDLKSVLAG